MTRFIVVFFAALALSGCMQPMRHFAAARPTPESRPVSGQQTQLLAIRTGAALDPQTTVPAPIAQFALPWRFQVAPSAANNGIAYYAGASSVTAFDLLRGAVRWSHTADIVPSSIVASADGVAFNQRYPLPWVYLDASTGAQRVTMKDTMAAGSLDGLMFAKNNDTSSYFAFDAKTAEKVWGTYGGGMQIAGPPQIHDGVLLQLFVNDGAILENVLYGFDPANGRAKWSTLSNTQPLGFRGDAVYVDSTWFPEQLEGYIPLSVCAIDIRSGKRLDEFTYAPDPVQNAATYRNTPIKAYVSGGFVYLKVNGTWYRYDADRDASAAHPSRIEHLDIAAAFDGGRLLVDDGRHAYLGVPSDNAITLRELQPGALAAPVAQDSSGASYAVAGPVLYRFDAQGNPQALGRVECKSVQAILPWPGNVAVMCAQRELLFRNTAQSIAPIPVAPRHAPHARLQLHAFTLPPAPGFMHQWWVGAIAPWSNNGVVMALDHGAMNFAGAIAFVSKDGTIRTVQDGRDLPPPSPGARAYPTLPRSQWPPKPGAVVYDTAQNVWFNNALWPALYKLDSSDRITSTVVGEASRGASWGPQGAIRLVRGPDGRAWFARSHPSREIARADGSRAIPIPPQYGDALILAAASDGFWFVSQTQLVLVTLAGKFVATALPMQLQNMRTGPGIRMTSAGDSVWIANGAHLARMNERGVLGRYDLPDATLGVNAMITACDGSLYVAETAPEVLRLRPGSAKFERYDIDYRQLDGFTRTPDCTIWFAEGSNMPTQHVGTLALTD